MKERIKAAAGTTRRKVAAVMMAGAVRLDPTLAAAKKATKRATKKAARTAKKATESTKDTVKKATKKS